MWQIYPSFRVFAGALDHTLIHLSTREFGPEGKVDASYLGHSLSYHLKGTNEGLRLEDKDLYVMINTYWEAVKFKIMIPGDWKLKIDTSKSNGEDFIAGDGKPYKSKTNKVKARSVVVLVK